MTFPNGTPRRHILLVEDDLADAHLVRLAIGEEGGKVAVHHVLDGLEAFEFLKRSEPRFATAPRPDLILLDLNMPRMDGREFLAEVRHSPDLMDIPVVVLTTSDVERDVLASYQLGAAGYVVKPVDLDEFTQAMRRLQDYWFALTRLPPSRT
ncbi:Response regulator rcp1 [Magnetospirillum sp. LM-5]|uniref:response regulator n=1 Tax=Magnetospirillum sp. LM-5 TaxID=2681466 RepID=UPI001385FD97|nr:response regulator [Magnetospirillum sp. LM-5]CAA7617787.1 Response regulator rcp1 [Magnetospirillum sp. LM-5]